MSDRYMRKCQIKRMRGECAELGIAVSENANKRQLEAALGEYIKDAAVVHTGYGVALRQTDKPTAEYSIHFSITGTHTIRAESEEAAREWMEENATFYYSPDIGDTDIYECDIHDVDKVEED